LAVGVVAGGTPIGAMRVSAAPVPRVSHAFAASTAAGRRKRPADFVCNAGALSFVGGGTGNNACDGNSAIGAGEFNLIQTPGNGGRDEFIGAGNTNSVTAGEAFVGAGGGNNAEGFASFVGAGQSSVASGFQAFVGAGAENEASGDGSFIGGGGYAYAAKSGTFPANEASGTDSFIGDGDQNSVAATEAFVGGGQSNSIAAAATYAVIPGGAHNSVSNLYGAVGGGESNNATGASSVVAGGADNTARATYATIPGGYDNAADGIGSFAAGTNAKARNNGSFVWSDNASTTALQSTVNYQFIARASGGYVLYSNAAATIGVRLAPNSGTWGSVSDRRLKTNVTPLDDAAVLQKVASLPVSEWSYTAERGVRHVGPMAQDFYAAFGVGEDDRHITSIDEDGVALAAIKALHAENGALEGENGGLRDALARDHARLADVRSGLAREQALRARDEARWAELRASFGRDRARQGARLAALESRVESLMGRPGTTR